eukprot:5626674-Pleurochrysis_carterae.AAC.3
MEGWYNDNVNVSMYNDQCAYSNAYVLPTATSKMRPQCAQPGACNIASWRSSSSPSETPVRSKDEIPFLRLSCCRSDAGMLAPTRRIASYVCAYLVVDQLPAALHLPASSGSMEAVRGKCMHSSEQSNTIPLKKVMSKSANIPKLMTGPRGTGTGLHVTNLSSLPYHAALDLAQLDPGTEKTALLKIIDIVAGAACLRNYARESQLSMATSATLRVHPVLPHAKLLSIRVIF